MAINSAAATSIASLYIGFYDRAPDPVGLDYWMNSLAEGVSLTDIAESFAASPEAAATYPYIATPNLFTPELMINQVFLNVLNRPADPDGLAYYSARLEAGESVGSVLASIIGNAATNADGEFPDSGVLANKVEVGLNWAETAGLSNNVSIYEADGETLNAAGSASAKGVIDGVDETEASVTEGNTETSDFFVGGGVGETFTLTTGNDFADVAGATRFNGDLPSDFKFTDASETVEAANGTLTGGDVLLDGSTADGDILNAAVGSAGGALGALSGATVGNIENVNVSLAGTVNGNFNLGNYTGVNNLTLSGTTAAAALIQITNFAAAGVSSIDTTGVTTATATVRVSDANADQDIHLTTGAGADQIRLGDGDNTITTGAGNDGVTVGDGNNTIDLGEGVNSATVGTAGEGEDSANTITGNAGIDTITIHNDSTNTISTLGNNDVITINGDGDNNIDAGAGNDAIVIAGGGDNVITAGAGADTVNLTGSAGDNLLIFNAGDSGVTTATADIVTAFASGSDTVDFNLAAGSATNYFEFAGAAATVEAAVTAATAHFDGTVQYVFVDNGANGYLVVDSDLDGAADMSVSLVGTADFAYTDIIA